MTNWLADLTNLPTNEIFSKKTEEAEKKGEKIQNTRLPHSDSMKQEKEKKKQEILIKDIDKGDNLQMTPESKPLMLECKVKIAEEENKRFDWKFKEETKLSNPELLKPERDHLIFILRKDKVDIFYKYFSCFVLGRSISKFKYREFT